MNQFHPSHKHPNSAGNYWVIRRILIKNEKNGSKIWRCQDAGYAHWDGEKWDQHDWDQWYGETNETKKEMVGNRT